MKKQIIFLFALAAVSVMSMTACGGDEKAKANAGDTAVVPKKDSGQTHAYVCPMGPSCGTGDKPGKCESCGMDLVENKTH